MTSRRLGGLAAALLALAAGGAVIAIASGWLHEEIRARLELLASESISGDLRIAELSGSLYREVVLRDVELAHEDRMIARVRELKLRFRLGSLFAGALRADAFELRGADIELVEDSRGWNVIRALEPIGAADADPDEASTEPFAFAVDLAGIRVRDSRLIVALLGQTPITTNALELDAHLRAGRSSLAVTVERVAAAIEGEGLPSIALNGALAAELDDDALVCDLRSLDLSTSASRIALAGRIDSKAATQLELKLDPIAREDLALWLPGLRLPGPLSGRVGLSGPLAATLIDAHLRSGDARLVAQLAFDLESTALSSLSGDLKIENAQLEEFVDEVAGVVQAAVEIEAGRAELMATLQVGEGRARLAGRSTWIAPYEFDLDFSAHELDLSAMLPKQPQLAGMISATGEVRGSGTSFVDARGEMTVDLKDSRIGDVDGLNGDARLRLADELVTLDVFKIRSRASRLDATGRVALGGGGVSALQLTADVPAIDPWLALAGTSGSGALQLSASVDGRRDRLRLRVDTTLVAVSLGSLEVANAALGVVAHVNQTETSSCADFCAELTADLTATGIGGAVEIGALHATARSKVANGRADGVLEAFEAETSLGSWVLVEPAGVRLAERRLTSEPLVIQRGEQRVTLQGDVSSVGPISLSVDANDWPIRELHDLIPQLGAVDGSVDAQLRIGGQASQPEIELSAQVSELLVDVGKVPSAKNAPTGGSARATLAGLDVRAEFRDGKLRLESALKQTPERVLTLTGELPFLLGWKDAFFAEPRGPFEARLASAGIDLAFANALAGGLARDLAGDLVIDLHVRGPLDALTPSGTLAIRRGSLEILGVGTAYSDIELDAQLVDGRIEIERLVAAAGEGKLNASGRLAMRAYVPGSLEAKLSLSNWPLIRSRAYKAVVTGDLRVAGAPESLVVGGDVEVVSGTLRPSLDFLTAAPPPRDPTISFERDPVADTSGAADPSAEERELAARSEWFKQAVDALALDVGLKASRNLWVKHENAELELAADMRATKLSGKSLALSGEIRSIRGWADLQGRRFRIAEGSVAFTGGTTIDPTLDILGKYRTAGYDFDAMLTGTASAPVLEIRSVPELEQADILAVLLFGRPVSELGQGEQQSIGRQAANLAAQAGVAVLGRKAKEVLGVEDLGIQVEELSTSRAALGAYVGEKTVVSISQEFAPSYRRQFRIEYEFWPGWSVGTSTTSEGKSGAEVLWRTRY